MKDLGARIQRLRKSRALTQSALAEQLGVSNKAVSKWERSLSCPDVLLLPELARVLGVSVDSLLGADSTGTEQRSEHFLSLEKYLMGEFGYYTSEHHPEDEEILFLFDCPDRDDARHGTPALGERLQTIYDALCPSDASDELRSALKNRIGVSFISDVPLFVWDDELSPLVNELEYTRLNSRYIHPLLFERFAKKMDATLTNENIKVIAITRWWNQKYLGVYLGQTSPKTLCAIQERIRNGSLRFLFVGLPHLWAQTAPEGKSHLYELPVLIEYVKKYMKN